MEKDDIVDLIKSQIDELKPVTNTIISTSYNWKGLVIAFILGLCLGSYITYNFFPQIKVETKVETKEVQLPPIITERVIEKHTTTVQLVAKNDPTDQNEEDVNIKNNPSDVKIRVDGGKLLVLKSKSESGSKLVDDKLNIENTNTTDFNIKIDGPKYSREIGAAKIIGGKGYGTLIGGPIKGNVGWWENSTFGTDNDRHMLGIKVSY